MKVTCSTCQSVHDLAPPPWVVASGRAFSMTCAHCGARQDVFPTGLQVLDDGTSGAFPSVGHVVVDPAEAPAPAPARHTDVGQTLVEVTESEASLSMPVPSLGSPQAEDSLSMPVPSLAPIAREPEPEPEVELPPPALDAESTQAIPVLSGAGALLAELHRPAPPVDLAAPPSVDPAETLDATAPSVLRPVAPPRPTPIERTAPSVRTSAAPPSRPDDGPVRGDGDWVLKQADELFDVGDQATLQRWVLERRVHREDLLSYRGSPWVRAGDQEALALFFAAAQFVPGPGDTEPSDELGAPETTEESVNQPSSVGLGHLDAPPAPLLAAALADEPTLDGELDERPTVPQPAPLAGPAAEPVFSPLPKPPPAAQRRPPSAPPAPAPVVVPPPRVTEPDPMPKVLMALAAVALLIVLGLGWNMQPAGPVAPADPAPVAARPVPPPVPEAPAAPEPAPVAAATPPAASTPRPASTTPRPATNTPRPATNTPRPAAAAAEHPTPRVTEAALATPRVAATPTAPPAPAPAPTSAARDTRYDELVGAGWAAIDRGAVGEALSSFGDAVSLQPSGVDANYGLGYALLKSGRPSDARLKLCRARARAGEKDRREIEAVLSGAGLGCD